MEIEARLLEMGASADAAIEQAVAAVAGDDDAAARQALAYRAGISRMETEIDDLAVRALARRRPSREEARFITVAVKTANELDCIGDLTVRIAEQALLLNERSRPAAPAELAELGWRVRSLIRLGVDACTGRRVDPARQAHGELAAVRLLHAEVIDGLAATMSEDSSAVGWGLQYVMVARSLEGIADHAAQIAANALLLGGESGGPPAAP